MTEDEARTTMCPKLSGWHVVVMPDGEIREWWVGQVCSASGCAWWVDDGKHKFRAPGEATTIKSTGHCGLIK